MRLLKNRGLPSQTGFTLIELLVVIAIIGILSSIVLASLNSARDKGNNASVKMNLDGVRSRAEIFYDDNSQSYSNLCSDPNVQNALTNALSAGNDPGSIATRCNANPSSWAANILLKVSEGGGTILYWCVDSQSKGKGESSELSGATVCT